MAQMCDLPGLTEVPPRGTRDSVGTSCPAPPVPLSSRGCTRRCPHPPGAVPAPQRPPPSRRCLADIFISVHTYTHSSPGSSVLAPSAGSALRRGHPCVSWGAGAKPVPPTPPPQPRSVYLGEKPPAAPRAGPCTVPLPQFLPGQRWGLTPTSTTLPPQGPHPPTRMNLGFQMLQLPRWSLPGGSSITLTPARGGCQAPVPSPSSCSPPSGGGGLWRGGYLTCSAAWEEQ